MHIKLILFFFFSFFFYLGSHRFVIQVIHALKVLSVFVKNKQSVLERIIGTLFKAIILNLSHGQLLRETETSQLSSYRYFQLLASALPTFMGHPVVYYHLAKFFF